MAVKNSKKVIGFVCIGLAVLLALAGYSFIENHFEVSSSQPQSSVPVSPEEKARIQAAAIEEVKLKAEQIKREQEQKAAPVVAKKQEIDLAPIVAEAKTQYDEAERNRKEGFLWVDRTNAKYVVNLGAVHGVLPGSYLTIYRQEERVGQVTVDAALDVISYVRPLDSKVDLSLANYYRVVKE